MFAVEVAALFFDANGLDCKISIFYSKAFEVDATAEHSIIYRG